LSATSQESVPSVITSAVPQSKDLDAEEVTTMAVEFLKRIGHKGRTNPKRVSLEETTYTAELEMKKFVATVKFDSGTREIKEYDVQPKTEESSMLSISPKIILTVAVISVMIHVGLFFGFKILGL
jgi:hypothetical protein